MFSWQRKEIRRLIRRVALERCLRFETLETRNVLSLIVPDGPGLQVAANTNGYLDYAAVASDAAGDFVVVWNAGKYGSADALDGQLYNAAGVAVGSQFFVVKSDQSASFFPAVAMDAAGDFVIAWQGEYASQSNPTISAQRYNAAGVAQGGVLSVSNAPTTSVGSATVAMDSTGDFVITWSELTEQATYAGIFGQRYNADGTAAGSNFQVNTIDNVDPWSTVAMDAQGDFVVAWSLIDPNGNISRNDVRLFNSSGIPQGSEFQVGPDWTNGVEIPVVAMDAAGDFVVTWNSAYNIYAERFHASGASNGSQFLISASTTLQTGPTVAMDAEGDFIVSWSAEQSASTDFNVLAQRYDSSGAAQQGLLQVNAADLPHNTTASVAIDATADPVFTWNTAVGSSYSVYAQRFRDLQQTGGYETIGSEFRVNSYTTGTQRYPNVASDADGNFVAVWQDYGQNTINGTFDTIYAQRFSAAGAPLGSEFQVNDYTTADPQFPTIAMNAAGEFVIAWTNIYVGNPQIYARVYDSGGAPLGTEFLISGGGSVGSAYPAVALDAAGDFVLTWHSLSGTESVYELYAERYNATGVAQGSQFQVNSDTVSPTDQKIDMDAAGDFVIAWQSNVGGDLAYGVYARRYNAAGVPQGSEFEVDTPTKFTDYAVSLAMDSAGDFTIGWSDTTFSGPVSYALRYNAAGVAQGSAFAVGDATNETTGTIMAADAAGDLAAVWAEPDGSGIGVFAQRYSADGTPAGSEFRVNTYTRGAQADFTMSMDAQGDLLVSWASQNEDGSGYGVYAQRYSGPGTMTIPSAANDVIVVTFTDADDFMLSVNGGAAVPLSAAGLDQLVYTGPSNAFSKLVFDDAAASDSYSATQSLDSTTVRRTGGGDFAFDTSHVDELYIYASSPGSTAEIDLAAGSGSNFFVDAANGGYSYLADPGRGIYSELSGFGAETATGAGGTTYAYVYSTSHASFIGDPQGSSFTVGGATTTLNDFPQVYQVGAPDGTDTATLHTEGGSFVGTPSFSYVSGTFEGSKFLVGALYAANVTAKATSATDSAFFYSYPGDTFAGGATSSSLTGSAKGFANFAAFVAQATGFAALAVQESGSGTDVANLTSPGSGTFTETSTVSTLDASGVTITVNTFYANQGATVAVPSKVNVTGNANGSDTANLYDAPGSNALVAQNSTAALTTSTSTVVVSQFGKVNAYRQSGSQDTVSQQSIDFALQIIGGWTSP